jgi:hypothetical protein
MDCDASRLLVLFRYMGQSIDEVVILCRRLVGVGSVVEWDSISTCLSWPWLDEDDLEHGGICRM